MTLSLIEQLKKFNQKERFYLVNLALYEDNCHKLVISDRFKKLLEVIFNDKNLTIPNDYFATIDYHFDWIYASLCMTTKSKNELDFREVGMANIYSNKNEMIKGTQEDIDFLIAFKDSNIYHLLFIEAKVETGWTNKQFSAKANRLKSIFGDNGDNWEGVIPYFAIISPYKPKQLDINNIPNWMKSKKGLYHVNIELPELHKVTRCNESGCQNGAGKFWKVERVR